MTLKLTETIVALIDASKRTSAPTLTESKGRYSYANEAALGVGGMAVVFRARDNLLQRDIALKMPHDKVNASESFLREAVIGARLDHPAIVPVYDIASNENGLFVTMKVVDGPKFDQVIADAKTFEDRLVHLSKVIAVAEGIASAHAQGIAHCDIKPSNVVLGHFGETFIIDWGLAVELNVLPPTQRPMAAGTPAFMAPEQAREERCDQRTDVYLLGALLYFVISGRVPREAANVEQAIELARTVSPPRLSEVEPKVPPQLQMIVERAMAFQPQQRHESALEFANQLLAFRDGRLIGTVNLDPHAESADFHNSGDHFSAYDAAMRGLEFAPKDLVLQHRAVLSLANSGALQAARKLYDTIGLKRWLHPTTPLATTLDIDVVALNARLTKDFAFAQGKPFSLQHLREAADRYAALFERVPQDTYPAINASTLYRLAGDWERAEKLAREVLRRTDAPQGDEYWRLASRIEAFLVLGDVENAKALCPATMAAVGARWADLATTRKQLGLLVDGLQLNDRWNGMLMPPMAVHYCGHIVSSSQTTRLRVENLSHVKRSIGELIAQRRIGFAFGSLAAGSDLIFAEALLENGSALEVVLPFAVNEFIEASVRPAGKEWVTRFEKCMAKARAVHFATTDAWLGDDGLFAWAARLAMGLTVLRANALQTNCEQLAVWDGQATNTAAGTSADIAVWKSSGRRTAVVPVEASSSKATVQSRGDSKRHIRSMLFADVKGFSKLLDQQIPSFVEHIMGAMGDVLERHSAGLVKANTWGDGLFVVYDNVAAAARCALALQKCISTLEMTALGLPLDMSLRLGAHIGPVYELRDPILHSTNFFGSHVSRAARIEPVTPPGSVYVTESFAAAIALEHPDDFVCDYVGVVSAAKHYGDMRMFLLRPRLREVAE
jgi:serine/threonine protein kinase/class 3 adenylate cyclase